MTVHSEFTDVTVRLWRLARQTGGQLRNCMDELLRKYNITTERYEVLVSIKYLGEYVNITDVASWLRRSTNSVSMIIDRMVKAGLVRRVRNKRDRRLVRLIITEKGENIIQRASPACWEIINEILSPLSYEDRQTFVNLFEIVDYKVLECLNPGKDIEEMVRKTTEKRAKFMKQVPPYARISIPEVKRQNGKKRKTM